MDERAPFGRSASGTQLDVLGFCRTKLDKGARVVCACCGALGTVQGHDYRDDPNGHVTVSWDHRVATRRVAASLVDLA